MSRNSRQQVTLNVIFSVAATLECLGPSSRMHRPRQVAGGTTHIWQLLVLTFFLFFLFSPALAGVVDGDEWHVMSQWVVT